MECIIFAKLLSHLFPESILKSTLYEWRRRGNKSFLHRRETSPTARPGWLEAPLHTPPAQAKMNCFTFLSSFECCTKAKSSLEAMLQNSRHSLGPRAPGIPSIELPHQALFLRVPHNWFIHPLGIQGALEMLEDLGHLRSMIKLSPLPI